MPTHLQQCPNGPYAGSSPLGMPNAFSQHMARIEIISVRGATA